MTETMMPIITNDKHLERQHLRKVSKRLNGRFDNLQRKRSNLVVLFVYTYINAVGIHTAQYMFTIIVMQMKSVLRLMSKD